MISIVFDMSDAFDGLLQPITLRTKTVTTVDFVESVTTSDTTIQAVCQRPELDKLNVDQIDYNLEYVQAHSTSQMDVGQFLVWNNQEYKIVSRKAYPDYNYFKAIAEEVKP